MIIVQQKYRDGIEWMERLTEQDLQLFINYYLQTPSLFALKEDGIFEVSEEFWKAYEQHRAECRTWSRILYGLFCYELNDRR